MDWFAAGMVQHDLGRRPPVRHRLLPEPLERVAANGRIKRLRIEDVGRLVVGEQLEGTRHGAGPWRRPAEVK